MGLKTVGAGLLANPVRQVTSSSLIDRSRQQAGSCSRQRYCL